MDWFLANEFGAATTATCVGGVAWLAVAVIRRMAEHHQVLDIPNERSSHSRPVPRGGGLAIAGICLVGWFGAIAFYPDANRFGMACYGVGAAMIAAISLLDDLKTISSAVRFAVHGAAAALLMFGYGAWDVVALPWIGNVSLGWLGIPIAFVWIVGLTNADKFLGGIDGIAACQAIIAGIGWFVIGRVEGQWTICWLAMLVVASNAGFLVHNWHPARIFMGDVGSALLGYTFAFLALMAGCESPRLVLAGAFLVWPFVFDSAFTFWRRLIRRENVLAAHRSHLYQRLTIAGWSHSSVTLLYAGLDLSGVAMALLCASGRPMAGVAAVAMFVGLAGGLWILVNWQERRHRNAAV